MATVLMLMLREENIDNKQQMWEIFHRMHLVCTICMGMCGSFVRMFGMKTIMEHLLMAVLGKLEVIVVEESVVAAPGSSIPGGVAPLTASALALSCPTSTLLVFVL